MEKRREGICSGWKKDIRGVVRGGKKTRGELYRVEKDERGVYRVEKRREGICTGWKKDMRGVVRGGKKMRGEVYRVDKR